MSILVLLSLVIILFSYWIIFAYLKLKISLTLVENAKAFSMPTDNYTRMLLVLGDSTAVGVGVSNSSDSVPALMAKYLDSTYVENLGVSGATVKSMAKQIEHISKDHYDVALIQIGANDIMRFHDITKVESGLEIIITYLKEKADSIVFISAGNVGGAPLIPPPLRPFYTRLNLKYHKHFEMLARRNKIQYINLYLNPNIDPFFQDSKNHFAMDSFHPSSLGYAVWFDIIKQKFIKQ